MEEYNQNINEVPTSENRERNAEVLTRLMRMAKGIDGLDGRTAQEIFTSEDESARRELISTLSDEQYCQLITGINGILRGKEKEDWNMDGVGVTAIAHEVRGAHIFPNYPDKKDIIVKSWEGAQQMNASGRDLEEIGMLLGSILVETHPFGDGNGRTSRLVYLMTKGGYSKEEMQKILGEYGRDEFDMALEKGSVSNGGIDTVFEKKYGRLNEINKHQIAGVFADEDAGAFGTLVFPEGIDEDTKESIIQGGRNDDNVFIAGVLSFLEQHPEIEIDEFVKTYGQRKIIILQHLISKLSNEQIKELSNIYWEMKKKYTEDMIDIFVNPDKPEYKIEKDGKEVRLIDYFKQRIADGEMLY